MIDYKKLNFKPLNVLKNFIMNLQNSQIAKKKPVIKI